MIEQFYFIESVISLHCHLHFWRISTHISHQTTSCRRHLPPGLSGLTKGCKGIDVAERREVEVMIWLNRWPALLVVGERGSLLGEKVHRLTDIPRIFMALLRIEKDIVSVARVAQVTLPDLLILDLNCYEPLNSHKIKHLLWWDLSKTIRTNSL